ncbi:dihydropteroate synthase [Bacillus salacetis]|uniref:Dihydropteroate synthase n=1 Tax=Bacillus salacetis TaxID=2315464 RepID=A0A3A1QU23_9BACI|nr:dihydropteroate synthase [Bacillus salacetis]RIW29844.1 dihydropteroate synthase [Bacillus salacetis]
MTSMIKAGPYQLDYQNRTQIMGILNVTPDSFSDGGQYNGLEHAVQRAKEMAAEGADIIDIGGESTRPGHDPVPEDEEIRRVCPIIEAISKEVDIPISIDTYKAGTARKALQAGAHIINDVWGAKRDPEIAVVAAEFNVPIILMHNRENMDYTNFIKDALNDIQESIDIALGAGVPKENIILDPGIGFAKDLKLNLEMMRNLDRLVDMDFPVLLATSRKRMIGTILDLPVEERMEGTGATVCFGIQKGCQLVRVHDVKEIKRMAGMMDAMLGKGEYGG